MQIKRVATLILVTLGVGMAGMAVGQDDTVKTRQELMKSLGPGLGAVFRMIRGEREFDAAIAEETMLKVAEHGMVLPTLFPKGSHVGSNARELIWDEFEAFTAIYAELEAAGRAGAEAAAANNVEGVRASFDAVGSACGRCHERYRSQ